MSFDQFYRAIEKIGVIIEKEVSSKYILIEYRNVQGSSTILTPIVMVL